LNTKKVSHKKNFAYLLSDAKFKKIGAYIVSGKEKCPGAVLSDLNWSAITTTLSLIIRSMEERANGGKCFTDVIYIIFLTNLWSYTGDYLRIDDGVDDSGRSMKGVVDEMEERLNIHVSFLRSVRAHHLLHELLVVERSKQVSPHALVNLMSLAFAIHPQEMGKDCSHLESQRERERESQGL